MKCPHCGVVLPADARFCAGCGQALPGARVPVATGGTPPWVIVLIVAASALFFVMVLGIIAAIAIPNLLNAIDRGKQKRVMADMRAIGTALEAYEVDHREYPDAGSVDELRPLLEPTYIKKLPMTDGWNRALQFSSRADGYQIVSLGKDGVAQGCDGGATEFGSDICFVNGQFTQWPEGMQR